MCRQFVVFCCLRFQKINCIWVSECARDYFCFAVFISQNYTNWSSYAYNTAEWIIRHTAHTHIQRDRFGRANPFSLALSSLGTTFTKIHFFIVLGNPFSCFAFIFCTLLFSFQHISIHAIAECCVLSAKRHWVCFMFLSLFWETKRESFTVSVENRKKR